MRVAIIGASGFIGGHLYDYFKKQNIDVIGTFFKHQKKDEYVYLDATDKKLVEKFLIEGEFDFIILTSGNKNVKECENNYELAYQLNVKLVENIISALCKITKSRLLVFSSDYVFNGDVGNYRDTDIPKPKTNYGKTKLIAENLLLNSPIYYKIIRTSAVMSKGGVFFDWLIKSLSFEKELKLFSNVYFTPTPISFLCGNISLLVREYANLNSKIFHIVGEKKLSRFDFGKMCKKYIKSSPTFLINEKYNSNDYLFQYDLSMFQSDFVKKYQTKNFKQYIKCEINRYMEEINYKNN